MLKVPTTISLKPVRICPGYPSEARVDVHGSYKLIGESIKWYYSVDKKNWVDVEEDMDRFQISPDGLGVKLLKIKENMFLKFTANCLSGNLTAMSEANVQSKQYVLCVFFTTPERTDGSLHTPAKVPREWNITNIVNNSNINEIFFFKL